MVIDKVLEVDHGGGRDRRGSVVSTVYHNELTTSTLASDIDW